MFNVAHTLTLDTDSIGIISGIEGTGKTSLGIQICQFIHEANKDLEPFGLDNVVFTFEQFMERLNNAPRYSAILCDELVNFGFNREGMNRENILVMKALYQCRSKNLFLLMISPDLYAIDTIIRDWRSDLWFYIRKRGEVMAHVKQRKIYSRKVWWELAIVDTFGPIKGQLWKDCIKKKDKAFKEIDASRDVSRGLSKDERLKFNYILKQKSFKQSERGEILDCSIRTIRYDDKKLKEMGMI